MSETRREVTATALIEGERYIVAGGGVLCDTVYGLPIGWRVIPRDCPPGCKMHGIHLIASGYDVPQQRTHPSSLVNHREVLERDGYRCRNCGGYKGGLTVDHIIPRKLGGSNKTENLQTLCAHCNSVKGARQLPFQRRLQLR